MSYEFTDDIHLLYILNWFMNSPDKYKNLDSFIFKFHSVSLANFHLLMERYTSEYEYWPSYFYNSFWYKIG